MGLPMYKDPDDVSGPSSADPQQAAAQDVRGRIENELAVLQTIDDRSHTQTDQTSVDGNRRSPNRFATFTPPLRIVQDANNLRSLYPTLIRNSPENAEIRSTHNTLMRHFNRLDYLERQVSRLQLRDAQLRDLLRDVEDALSSSRTALSFIASAIETDQPITAPDGSGLNSSGNDAAENTTDADSTVNDNDTDETPDQTNTRES